MDFRSDINGLRALSVLLVVFYHFSIKLFPGGFVGVDVFFVISGFLMTGIILRPAQSRTFSLLQFYVARARRIIPALSVLCFALLILGWFILSPVDYVALAGQAGASMGFVSNVSSWWRAGDYFRLDSQSNWLLHTWSLSVEWQFYLVYPLYLAALHGLFRSKRAVVIGIVVALLVSFGANLYLSLYSLTAAFYLLPARAWELLIGGVVYLIGSPQWPLVWRKTGNLAGLALIAVSAIVLDGERLWPYFYALLPTIGAGLVIFSNGRSGVTEHPIVQFLGRASYSIYLWHWPVVVALRYLSVELDVVTIACGMALSVFLGAASYKVIEQPTISWLKSGESRIVRGLASFGTIPVIVTLAALVILLGGIPARVPPLVREVLAEETNGHQAAPSCSDPRVGCDIGTGPNAVVIWGDSIANTIVTAAEEISRTNRKSVKLFTHGGCPTVFGAEVKRFGPDHRCAEFNAVVWETLQTHSPTIPIIIVNRTSAYIEGFNEMAGGPLVSFKGEEYASRDDRKMSFVRHARETICEIAASRRVFFVKPIPEMGFNALRRLARNMMFHAAVPDVSIDRSAYLSRNKIALEMLVRFSNDCGAQILDPAPYLCDEAKCFGSKAGKPLYRDDSHLTEYGGKSLIPMLRKALDPAAALHPG